MGSPTMVEFHKTRMRLITIDKLRLTAGLLPNPALLRFALSKRVLAIVPFVLKEDLVGTGRNYFSREGVMELFLFGKPNSSMEG